MDGVTASSVFSVCVLCELVLTVLKSGIGHAPSSHIDAYVPVTGVPNPRPLKTHDLEAWIIYICKL